MGLAGVGDALKAQAEKKNSGGSKFPPSKLWLKIADGEEVQVRFLEQDEDFTTVYVHSLEEVEDGRRRFRDIVCLDQSGNDPKSCPGCRQMTKETLRRRFKFFVNVIWRDGPVFQLDDDGKIVRDAQNNPEVKERADVLALWAGGIRAAEELDHANGKYKGLTTRDFIIARKGEKLETTYDISPVGEEDDEGNITIKAVPLTEKDKEINANKYDLDELTKAPDSEETFFDNPYKKKSEGGSVESVPDPEDNPWRRRR